MLKGKCVLGSASGGGHRSEEGLSGGGYWELQGQAKQERIQMALIRYPTSKHMTEVRRRQPAHPPLLISWTPSPTPASPSLGRASPHLRVV